MGGGCISMSISVCFNETVAPIQSFLMCFGSKWRYSNMETQIYIGDYRNVRTR